jgi:hypothetical protein
MNEDGEIAASIELYQYKRSTFRQEGVKLKAPPFKYVQNDMYLSDQRKYAGEYSKTSGQVKGYRQGTRWEHKRFRQCSAETVSHLMLSNDEFIYRAATAGIENSLPILLSEGSQPSGPLKHQLLRLKRIYGASWPLYFDVALDLLITSILVQLRMLL